MPNVSHENHLIFMRMTVQVTYIFMPIVSLKDSFCHSGKSKLGIGLFIHELLREPLINPSKVQRASPFVLIWEYPPPPPRPRLKSLKAISYNWMQNFLTVSVVISNVVLGGRGLYTVRNR